MSNQALYVSILSLFLFNPLNAQTGIGCWIKSCPKPGQVRINANVDPMTGRLLSGCNCGCPPEMQDPTHRTYCAPPKWINFDVGTAEGDCACLCPIGAVGGVCIINGQAIMDTEVKSDCSCDTSRMQCPGNQVADANAQCGCPDSTIDHRGEKLWLPACAPPLERDPHTCDCTLIRTATEVPTTTTLPAPPVQTYLGPFPPQPPVLTVPPRQVAPTPPTVPVPPTIPVPPRHTLLPITPRLTGMPIVPRGGGGGGQVGPAPPAPGQVPPFVGVPPVGVPPVGVPPGVPAPPQVPISRGPALSVACQAGGDCGCPSGTQQNCIIHCDSANDACKDGIIRCNNDGFHCTVNCISGQACGGSAEIVGPAGGDLAVNCKGEQACEGATKISGEWSNNVDILCSGTQACKGGVSMNFGTGKGTLTCTGLPDSCLGIKPEGIHVPHGSLGFTCKGFNCPESAAPGAKQVMCDTPGDCQCPGGTVGDCTITCDGANDACKDGMIYCNNDGFNCVVNCVAGQACAGSGQIVGPAGGNLIVNCLGEQACEGSMSILGETSRDMTVLCEGMQSCKGSVQMNFGKGHAKLGCNGLPDACSGLKPMSVNIPVDAQSWSCSGNCPVDFPAAFGGYMNNQMPGGGGAGQRAFPPIPPFPGTV